MPALRDNLNLFVRQFALALERATRLQPGGPRAPAADADTEAELARTSTRHLPGAGWLLGLVAALVFALVALVLRVNPLGPLVAAIASTLAVLLLTGAAQESALFRAADALEPRLPGAAAGAGYGVVALVMLLLARVCAIAALGSVTEAGVLAALFAAPVVSRFAPLVAAHWLDASGEVDRATLQVAGLWCLPPLLLMLLAGGIAFTAFALLACGLAWVAMLRFFRRRPERFGPERAGSLQQACEAAFYLGAAVVG